MSLRRQISPFISYWLSPDRKSRRAIETSVAAGASFSVFQNQVTCAMFKGLRFLDPLKMTSSILSLRKDLALCSPRTQFRASTTLLFPQPFGPTTDVIPGKILRMVFSQKDLKPRISILSRNSIFPLYPVVISKSRHKV